LIAWLAFVLAALASIVAWPLLARAAAARITFVAISAGFAYWYWIPAVNILLGGYLGEDVVVPDPVVARDTVWMVLLYHLAAIGALAAVAVAVDPQPAALRQRREPALPWTIIGAGVMATAAALFLWYFADKGIGIAFQVLTGGVSARELMEFDNFSASIADSLRALLEMAVIFSALFLIAVATLERRLVSLASGFAFVAVILVFLGTGTRATLLMALVVIALAMASGRRVAARRTSSGRLVAGLLLVTALVVPIFLAISARQAVGTGDTNPVLGILVVNNDMFRELVFVMGQMQGYRSASPVDFLMTAFTYVTPGFLGFSRQIPDHLLVFNMTRNGIDLILGSGNVFPGIVADFQLVFGLAGAIAFAGFISGFALAIGQYGRLYPQGRVLAAAQCAVAAFLFFSFRNMHPGLVLVMIGAAAGLWALERLEPLLRARLPDARRA
jgi:hypothetical protein